jgi:hypothetical protein
MKIEATCETCDRRFLLSQIGPDSDAPGRCPFCGARFARHYSGVLVESVDTAEAAASDFVRAVGKLQSMETGFKIDLKEMVENLTGQIDAHDPAATSL